MSLVIGTQAKAEPGHRHMGACMSESVRVCVYVCGDTEVRERDSLNC